MIFVFVFIRMVEVIREFYCLWRKTKQNLHFLVFVVNETLIKVPKCITLSNTMEPQIYLKNGKTWTTTIRWGGGYRWWQLQGNWCLSLWAHEHDFLSQANYYNVIYRQKTSLAWHISKHQRTFILRYFVSSLKATLV